MNNRCDNGGDAHGTDNHTWLNDSIMGNKPKEERMVYGLEIFLRHAAHVVEFVVLSILVYATIMSIPVDSDDNRRTWMIVCMMATVGVVIFAWFDEYKKKLLQIEGRHYSIIDVGLNLIGVVVGIALAAVIELVKSIK